MAQVKQLQQPQKATSGLDPIAEARQKRSPAGGIACLSFPTTTPRAGTTRP